MTRVTISPLSPEPCDFANCHEAATSELRRFDGERGVFAGRYCTTHAHVMKERIERNASTFNAGHGRQAFATRVRLLLLHPEVWQAVPNGLTYDDYRRIPARRQLWTDVVDFLKANGVLSPKTSIIDVDVPKLVAAVRQLERERAQRERESTRA